MNRGRGSRRGGGRGAYSGPRLPGSFLRQELGLDVGGGGRGGRFGGGGRGRGGRGGGRGRGRGRGRHDEEQARRPTQPPPHRRPPPEEPPPRAAAAPAKRKAAPAAAAAAAPAPPAKRAKFGGSRFDELLGLADPEAALQAELAKKLGLKKAKGAKLGGGDGLDDVLQGLESGSDAGGESSGGGGQSVSASDASGSGSEDDGDDSDGGLGLNSESLSGSESGDEPGSGLEGLQSGGSDSDEEGSDDDDDNDNDDDDDDDDSDGLSGDSGDGLQGGSSGSDPSASDEGGSDSDSGRAPPPPAAAAAAAAAAPAAGRYLPPAARRAAAEAAGGGAAADEAAAALQRRVRGLLNRLGEANVPGVVAGLAAEMRSGSRRAVCDAVAGELVAAAAGGPRASPAFAAAAAAAVAGLGLTARAPEPAAALLGALAPALEAALAARDARGAHNLALLAAHAHACGALGADLLFSLLGRLVGRGLEETEVVAAAALLGAAGLPLRAADPVAMRDFVVAAHAAAAAAGAAPGGLSPRCAALLELVVDVKNNRARRREGKEAAGAGAPGAGPPPETARWLAGLRAGGAADAARVAGIPWAKAAAADKRGAWWLPTAADAPPGAPGAAGAAGLAGALAAAAGGGEAPADPRLAAAARALRMTTPARRAAFVVVMASEDCADAAEKLLRLGLRGEGARELVRVPLECAAAEASWNPYYGHLLARLAAAARGHRATLANALRDAAAGRGGWAGSVVAAPGARGARATANLARAAAAVVAGARALPAAALLRGAGFAARGAPPRAALFWRVFFEHALGEPAADADAEAVWARLAAAPGGGALAAEVAAHLGRTVGPWLAAKTPGAEPGLPAERLELLLRRCRAAERALRAAPPPGRGAM